MKYARTWVGIVALFMTLLFAVPAIAHEYQTDNQVRALLHINTDSERVLSGVPTSYTLAFFDKTGSFSTKDCDCTIVIKDGDKTIATQDLSSTRQFQSDNTTTFLKTGTYTLTVKGEAKDDPHAFQPFTLTYTLKVEQGPLHFQQLLPWIVGVCALTLVITSLILGGVVYHKKAKKKSKGTKPSS